MVRKLLRRFIGIKVWCDGREGYVSVFFLCICIGVFRYKGGGWAEVITWENGEKT